MEHDHGHTAAPTPCGAAPGVAGDHHRTAGADLRRKQDHGWVEAFLLALSSQRHASTSQRNAARPVASHGAGRRAKHRKKNRLE
jgi:hypothetical protein